MSKRHLLQATYNKMFGLIKKVFLTGLTVLSSLVSVTLLSCISVNNQACKIRPKIINVMNLYFMLSVLKQVIAVVVVTISMIHMQKCVFRML